MRHENKKWKEAAISSGGTEAENARRERKEESMNQERMKKIERINPI